MFLSNDPYRPSLHFTAPFGWLNDPNGLVHHNGEWHLFYQYYPHGNKWDDMHWGHAVSRDLTNWSHLPIALKPNELGVCFSGSAIIDSQNVTGFFEPGDANMVAFYTNTAGLSANQPDGLQMQSIASSKDGVHFDQHVPLNPIIPNSGKKNFRDPKVVWHDKAQHWNLVITEGEEIGIYSSTDLINWTKESVWGEGESFHNDSPWECPDLFPMIDDQGVERWVLVMGVINRNVYTPGSGTHYVIGDFDGKTFTNLNSADTVLWMDYGRDFYATQSWSNTPDNRTVAIAWMSNWMYANDVPATSHRSAMSFPRELQLVTTDQGLRLCQSFPTDGLQEQERAGELWGQLLSCNDNVELSAPQQASLVSLTITADESIDLMLKPFGHDELTYHITQQGDEIVVKNHRHSSVKGDEHFQQNFAHDNEFRFPVRDELTLDIVRDTTSCEILFDGGLVSTTESMFTEEFGAMTLTNHGSNIVINTVKELVKG